MRCSLSRLKLNSSAEWVMFSKPMKAHGEINAILRLCAIALFSGTKAGAQPPRCAAAATTKHRAIPAVNTHTSTTIKRAVAFSFRTHSSVTPAIAASVSRASPRYTSYPNTVKR